MISLLYGTDIYSLKESLEKLLKKNDPQDDRMDTVFYDASAEDFNYQTMIDDCNSNPFFHDRKTVVVKNPSILAKSAADAKPRKGKSKKNKSPEDEAEEQRQEAIQQILSGYLKNPNPAVDLIFYFDDSAALDSKSEGFKLLDAKSVNRQVFDNPKDANFATEISKALQKNHLDLSPEARQLLKERTGGSKDQLYQAVDKMLAYGSGSLNAEDIDHLVPQNGEVPDFALTNAFMNGNVKEALRISRRMAERDRTYMIQIAQLASTLRRAFIVKTLQEEGVSQQEIGRYLNMKNDYGVVLINRSTAGYDSRSILRMLADLAKLDQDIKGGKVNDKDGFELFLVRKGMH
jgi:DNA polymerase-3 subunit delta